MSTPVVLPQTLGEAMALARGRVDRLDARLLLEFASGCTHVELLTRPENPLPAPAAGQFLDWLSRRAAGEPLAYLVGEAEFRGRVFAVNPAVLIPRPETEVLVDLAGECLAGLAAPRILDLGTGSGIVAISLALEHPAATVVAVDLSPAALDVAASNAGRLGARVDFRLGSWFLPVAGETFDLIVANPPYVAADDPHLALNGLPFEPLMALTDGVAGGWGTACVETIIRGASACLRPGGWLLVEHGHDQGEFSRNLLAASGFQGALTQPDLAGLDRVSGGQRP